MKGREEILRKGRKRNGICIRKQNITLLQEGKEGRGQGVYEKDGDGRG